MSDLLSIQTEDIYFCNKLKYLPYIPWPHLQALGISTQGVCYILIVFYVLTVLRRCPLIGVFYVYMYVYVLFLT